MSLFRRNKILTEVLMNNFEGGFQFDTSQVLSGSIFFNNRMF